MVAVIFVDHLLHIHKPCTFTNLFVCVFQSCCSSCVFILNVLNLNLNFTVKLCAFLDKQQQVYKIQLYLSGEFKRKSQNISY